MSKRRIHAAAPDSSRRDPVQELWIAVMERAFEDLRLWSNNRRLFHCTSDGASPVTGLCSIDSYRSAVRWICDETEDVTFTMVCHSLDLDPDATFEAFLKMLPEARRNAIAERRDRQLRKRDG